MTDHPHQRTEPEPVALRDHEATHEVVPHPQMIVLLVEDDANTAATLERLLSEHGCRVISVSSALMAKEALAENMFTIAMIDRDLQDGGLSLCADLRQQGELGKMFVILLTARDSVGDVLAALQAGADDCLSKQISEAELIARLNTAGRIVKLERALHEALADRTQTISSEDSSPLQVRTLLLRHIEHDVEHALKVQRALSVLAMDIDSFKHVNDEHGRGAGDELLRQLANRVRFALPSDQDWIARSGGEEFVVVLPGSDLEKAVSIAERLRAQVEATPFHVVGADVVVTVSLGVGSLSTLGEEEAASAQLLLDQADRYLYRSKLSGRNRVSAPSRLSAF